MVKTCETCVRQENDETLRSESIRVNLSVSVRKEFLLASYQGMALAVPQRPRSKALATGVFPGSQGLKPEPFSGSTARLKPCPDTRRAHKPEFYIANACWRKRRTAAELLTFSRSRGARAEPAMIGRRTLGSGMRAIRAAVACAALALGLMVPSGHAQTAAGAKAVCAQTGDIARKLAEITGWALLHPVPCDFIDKDQLNKYVKETMKKETSPSDIRAEEAVLKKFGFAPQDFDLAKTTVDLLTEQAAAFYDYHRKKLFVAESTPAAMDETVLAHELAHALADQHFNLAKYVRKGEDSDDGSTARLAVMEGQATWIMSEYMARKLGQSLATNPMLIAAMSAMGDVTGGQFPVFENAPLYFRLTLLFPYTKGLLFQNALVERDRQKGFAEPFQRPPLSTQQILHSEKYFANEKPSKPDLPTVRLPHGYKTLVEGCLGELDESVLIEQFGSKEEAARLAPHWKGSAFQLRENRKAGRIVLLYAAEWDSEESARDYFALYKTALQKKWKSFKSASEAPDSVEGSGDDGLFKLRRSGTVVTSLEGLPTELN